jgi:hypothetical protein
MTSMPSLSMWRSLELAIAEMAIRCDHKRYHP